MTKDILTRQPTPILSLRDVVVFPHMVIPLFVARERSVKALEETMGGDKKILLVTQRNSEIEEPKPDELYEHGTMASILQMLRLPDGTTKVLVEGIERVEVTEFVDDQGYLAGHWTLMDAPKGESKHDIDINTRSLMDMFEQYVKLSRKVPPELMTTLSGIEDPSRLADTIAAHLGVRIEDKQEILETGPIIKRMQRLMTLIEGEMDVLKLEKRIRGRVKSQMEKSQREYYLNEQMKAIQRELGDLDETGTDLGDLETRIEKAGMPKEALEKARSELSKLKMMSPMSAEATVVRNYLDWMLMLPWKKRSKVSSDLSKAESVLESDHFGLERVKERILEFLAVQQRVKKLKGPILCLVGPPGVGKTSLGRSIAKATGREFIRMSLGGVRDEAEIRGHRRTYIGSMPGRVLQNMSKVGTRNPLFMLDELDKMSMDFRGDPASAMLEVLDPEQNDTFNDHYLEVGFDLSEVMFVATANSLNIPSPLLDRMEIIRIPGYTEDEKLNIAMRYLLPKQIKANGLEDEEIQVSESAVLDIIRYYTREAGVRSLERELAKLCRKVVKEISLKKAKQRKVTVKNLDQYLGVRRYRYGLAETDNEIGQVTGLAWTEVGGELLQIEAVALPGKGKLSHTGQLGSVMQESVQAALSVVRSRADSLGIPADFYQKWDMHVHVPEGATPKDGPSAGIAMTTALVSVLTQIPVRADVAMTGEITLRGKVLPIGGLKEKLLAALRGGIKLVLIPKDNEKDLAEIPDKIKKGLDIRPVQWIDEVLSLALESEPNASLASGVAPAATETSDPKGIRAH